MANENFGLSFTVDTPSIWTDLSEGKIGASSNVLGDVSALDKIGTSSNIFGAVAALNKIGPIGNINTDLLCYPNSVLSSPGQSTLSGPPVNILSCP